MMIEKLKARAFDLLRKQQVIGVELQRITQEIARLEAKEEELKTHEANTTNTPTE